MVRRDRGGGGGFYFGGVIVSFGGDGFLLCEDRLGMAALKACKQIRGCSYPILWAEKRLSR